MSKQICLLSTCRKYCNCLVLFIPCHMIVVGYYGIILVVHVSVSLSSIHSQMITEVNVSGFSSNLICALILWRSGVGLLMGKFC